MTRAALVDMSRRTLAHARAGSIPQADQIGRVAAFNYHDPDRFATEMDRIFKRAPLVLGFSCELSSPHGYKAIEVAGVPVLITRPADGVVRAFVNMCSHRGAIVVPEGTGSARRFTCPYHAWNYNGEGQLVGILDREMFGEIDMSCSGLTPLPVAERAGIIFVVLTPGAELDLESYLCGYDEMLAHLDLENCNFVGSQSVDGPNWKVAYDGYLDFYHLPILHKNSFGPDYANKAIYDAWGPHQRVSSPDHRMMVLDEKPEEDWPDEILTNGVWTIFPHVSIAGFAVKADGVEGGGRMFMISTLYPGADADSSFTIQNFLTQFELNDDLESLIETQKEFLLGVVRDEDYFTGKRIQRAVKTGAKKEFLFGRNEAGGQRFHQWVNRLVETETDEAFAALFAEAEVIHQP